MFYRVTIKPENDEEFEVGIRADSKKEAKSLVLQAYKKHHGNGKIEVSVKVFKNNIHC